MNDTYVTIAGNAVEDPVRRLTSTGDPFVHFRLASTPRRRTASGEYVDGDTSFVDVHAFRGLARNAAASIDELYLFLTNLTAIEYIRNFMKRVRKKDSAVILASQNLEDFALPGVAELTKPLFSIPTHTFLFNAGNIDARFYMDTLQLEQSEYDLIRYPQRGVCLYKCGNERYNLAVHAPDYKEKLFGSAGGR